MKERRGGGVREEEKRQEAGKFLRSFGQQQKIDGEVTVSFMIKKKLERTERDG